MEVAGSIPHILNCGHSSSVERELPKLQRRVRFPLTARRNLIDSPHGKEENDMRKNDIAIENIGYIRGINEIRRSNASGFHEDKRTRRIRTRLASKQKAIRESLYCC